METVFYVGGMVVLWAINLLNGTGLGDAYRTTEYAQLLLIIIAVFIIQKRIKRDGACLIEKRYFYVLLLLVIVFVAVSLINGQGFISLRYLWAFLVTFILANTHPSRKILRWVGFCFAGLGLAVLFIFNYMDALDGWNANTIAMIGLFSYLIFIIPYYGVWDFRSFIMLTATGGAYIFMIWRTDSRSCIIAIIIALIMVFRVVSVEKLLSSKIKIVFVLLVPLLVAVFISAFSLFNDVTGLDEWSIERFGKPIFNGRDQTWLLGFQALIKTPLFGSGSINNGIWHNSAITCLTAYGIVGYALWTRLFYLMLSDTIAYQYDICVMGSLTAFTVTYWQQSVELGLFSSTPNLLPYAMLGLLLGRVNCLKERDYEG